MDKLKSISVCLSEWDLMLQCSAKCACEVLAKFTHKTENTVYGWILSAT